MLRYWIKNRLLLDLAVPCILLLLIAFAFIFPMLSGIGEAALMQGIYKNDCLDFDVPSPSFEQIGELEAKPFIESVFPYYYTQASLSINGRTRETNLYLSDAFDKLEQTMYCDSRLIEKSNKDYDNPILIDYQFARDVGAGLGDVVSVTFNGTKIDFRVSAIYETNTYKDGGAVMVKWEGAQKDAITAISPNLAYSGAYIHTSQHAQCEQYLKSEYKPYGRLKDRSEFATQESYDIQYNAFMSADYSNEITDFSVKAEGAISNAEEKMSTADQYLMLACIVAAAIMLSYNFILWTRYSEREYFAKRKLLGAKNLAVYYLSSTILQAAVLIIGAIASMLILPAMTELYAPRNIVFAKAIIFILAMAAASILILIENTLLAKETKR